MTTPRYPVYVISKGRSDRCLTARFLARDGVPFRLVVEPAEADAYEKEFGRAALLVTPENFSERGDGSIPVRNFVWEHAVEQGAPRHWILDDNIGMVRRLYRRRRIPCNSGPAFAAIEDFVDRYENVGIAGMAYQMYGFGPDGRIVPFWLNVHVYSCLLIDSTLPFRWRGRYNEDTDLCLQTLAAGLCTVLVNVFLIDKKRTMTMQGGNADLYAGDGRAKMARALERVWPGVVRVERRYGRPQHVVNWKKFDTPLRPREGVEIPARPDEYGLRLAAVRDVQSPELRKLRASFNRKAARR